ncbi:MAG: 30S ribosomal protein S13 [Candidatus Woesearchaeota archaeon]|nr:MAG: 30S ribosomal protein S13 [Candidatus Woesearchaeota archaeon]
MAEFKHIVRVGNTDLKGDKAILFSMRKIKGVGIALSNAILSTTGIDKTKKAGDLSDKEVLELTKALEQVASLPSWLLNRRKDVETGEDTHLLQADLDFTKDNDIKRMKKCKSYKGLRHQWRLPVRGQKTKSNFRRNKGKGVAKKKQPGRK